MVAARGSLTFLGGRLWQLEGALVSCPHTESLGWDWANADGYGAGRAARSHGDLGNVGRRTGCGIHDGKLRFGGRLCQLPHKAGPGLELLSCSRLPPTSTGTNYWALSPLSSARSWPKTQPLSRHEPICTYGPGSHTEFRYNTLSSGLGWICSLAGCKPPQCTGRRLGAVAKADSRGCALRLK